MTAVDLNDPRVQKLLLALKSGVDLETACHYAELSVVEVYRWMELGKTEADRITAGDAPDLDRMSFVTLWHEMKRTRAEVIVRNAAQIQSAANAGEWRAAAWWLERQVPHEFSRPASESRGAEIAKESTRQIES